MSKELLKALVDVLDDLKLRKNLNEDDALNISDSVFVRAEKAIENYLAQPEQTGIDAITDKPTITAMAVMPNGICVSNVYDAFEAGRASVISDQEPVAWITEWQDKQVSGSIWSTQTKRALSFTREGAMVVLHPNYIPLYLAPPKREPLSDEEIEAIWGQDSLGTTVEFVRAIEKAHGIGECNSHYKERHETFGEEV